MRPIKFFNLECGSGEGGPTVEPGGEPVCVDSGPEATRGVECRPKVVQHRGHQGGLLSCWLHGQLETQQRLLETPQAAVGHTHRQVQQTW